jgi:two-component system sensor histidine kinase KdpD
MISWDNWLRKPISHQSLSYVWSTAAVASTVVAGLAVSAVAPLPNISMIFLMAVLFSAVSFGIWPAIYASVLSFLAYNFFFIEPLYTFQIAEPHELLALIIFLIVAIVTSALAGRVRDQARAANERARTMRRLYEFTWKLSGLTGVDEVADGAAGEIHASLRRPAIVLLDRAGELSLAAAWPPEDHLDTMIMDAARLAFARNESVGLDTNALTDTRWHFIPLRTQSRSIGVVGIGQTPTEGTLDADARALLATLAEQSAAAIERSLIAKQMVMAQRATETERVRNILLASISHDFRTPLSSILGSATSLLDFRDRLGATAQTELLRGIKDEAEGLNDMVRNLLAMTRIDAGALELRRDWIDLREIAERVIGAAKRRGSALSFVSNLPTLPMIRADAVLLEQALGNVVNNAGVHTPAGTRAIIDAIVTTESVGLSVTDDGPGIPISIVPRVFDKFVRAHRQGDANDHDEGTGLGLAIAKGIVTAHGGSITAESPVANGRGTCITLTFPRERQQ